MHFEEDEQYARDLQVALDTQAREERRARKRREKGHSHESVFEDGFTKGALNADHMLFVACTMDSHEVAMLVDTGASTSAMSMEMVTLLELEHKLNRSIYGNAKGVGSSSILGILENVNCMIGEDVGFRSFFMVLEGSMPYCILGLDQMRRFNCLVDVGGNVLLFGGKDGVSVPFLPKEMASSVAYTMMYETNGTAAASPPPALAAAFQDPSQQTGNGWGSSWLPFGKKGK